MDDEQLAQLRKAVADMERALAADDLHAWAAADARFHMLLVDFCGNARLKSLVGTFWDQSHRARLETLRLRPRPLDSNRDHAALVDAITRRDAETARVIHRQHRIRMGRILVSLLKEHRLTQL